MIKDGKKSKKREKKVLILEVEDGKIDAVLEKKRDKVDTNIKKVKKSKKIC